MAAGLSGGRYRRETSRLKVEMASKMAGPTSKTDSYQRRGQAWLCTTGLPSDIVVEVDQMSFHLHKFPLVSRSQKLAKLVEEVAEEDGEICHVQLNNVPGGSGAFELAAKFCYGAKVELSSTNVVALRCVAEYLEMTQEFGEGNLIAKTEAYLVQVVLQSWPDSVSALQSCSSSMPEAQELGLVEKLVDSVCAKASMEDGSLGRWPMPDHQGSLQSPGGSLLWNGISTGARSRARGRGGDWWYEDVSLLSWPLFEKVITSMEGRGVSPESISGALMHYAKKGLPGLHRRHSGREAVSHRKAIVPAAAVFLEDDQRLLLETIEGLLPLVKGVASTRFLFGLLRTATILNASPGCKSSLEKRIGMQLEQATLDELLMPNYSYVEETLYDIDVVQRILDHFLLMEQNTPPESDEEGLLLGSPAQSPIMLVAKLLDAYLAEIAPDVNLKPSKFQSLAEALPDYSRTLDDGLYRAIDIYLKAHPWLLEAERERICKIMNCQKLSLEACTHAAQNERLPLRVVVQVLFFEQLQLRTAIAGSFLVADNIDRPSRRMRSNTMSGGRTPLGGIQRGEGGMNVNLENQALKGNMDKVLVRVSQLEHQCTSMRQEIEKLHKSKKPLNSISKALGCKIWSPVIPTTGDTREQHRVSGDVGSTGGRPRQRTASLHTRSSSSLS